MPKVYITHDDGRFDLSDATRFGEIIAITSQDFFPDTVDKNMPRVHHRAVTLLREFKPEEDFLCLVGSPIVISLCSFVLGKLFPRRRITILRFDKHEQAYYPVTF